MIIGSLNGYEESTVVEIQWPVVATGQSHRVSGVANVIKFLLEHGCDGLGVLQAHAVQELVPSFPDGTNGDGECQ